MPKATIELSDAEIVEAVKLWLHYNGYSGARIANVRGRHDPGYDERDPAWIWARADIRSVASK